MDRLRLAAKTALACALIWWAGDLAIQVGAVVWRMW